MPFVGDGDQTPVKGEKSDRFRSLYSDLGTQFTLDELSELQMNICFGSHEEVRRILEAFGGVVSVALLQQRSHGGLRLSPIHLAVFGAQRIKGPMDGRDYAKTVKLLLERGAEREGRDVAGNTPLHHSTSQHPQLGIARALIEAGADVNAKNRFGCVPLTEAVMDEQRESVKLLLLAGADPEIANNDGVTPMEACRPNKALLSFIERTRAAAWGDLVRDRIRDQVCEKCGKGQGDQKLLLCGRCRKVYYCSAECQKSHWKEHKGGCNLDPETETAVVGISSGGPKGYSKTSVQVTHKGVTSKDVNISFQPPKKVNKEFDIKIQVGMGPTVDMMVYNQDRSFTCFIKSSEKDFKKIYDVVTTRGALKLKGYFRAFITEEKKLVVLLNKMLPTPPW